MRVVTFVVSRTFGSLGAQAQTLIEDIGRRTHLFLCLLSLLNAHEASWATMPIISFIRSALTLQVLKRVAVILREHLPDDFLPPPPQTPLTASDQGNSVGKGRGRAIPGPYSARDGAFGWASGVARPRVARTIRGAVASIFCVQRDPMMRLCVFKHVCRTLPRFLAWSCHSKPV